MPKKINKHLGYIFLLIPIVYSFLNYFNSESDIWFLFSHGRYVLSNGFPHTDFLSMHSGLHFVMQQWLSSVIFYIIYNLFGTIGIYILVWISNILIIYLIYKLCMKISDNNILVSSFFTNITSAILNIAFITCRPMIFSFIIFILLLYIMESYVKKKNKIIYFLILLSILQINLHASMWPLLFILLLPYLTHYAYLYLKDKDRTIFKLLLITLLMILVGFINPYGIESMTYSLHSYGISDINATIWEMHGLNFNSSLQYVKFFSYITFFIMILVSYIFINSKKKIPIYRLLLFYGTFLMALFNIRNIPIFAICSITACSASIEYKPKYIHDFNTKYKIAYSILLVTAVIYIYSNKSNYILSDTYLGQKNILNYIEKKHISKEEPLYTINTNGSYFSYNGYKTYMDTRAEVFLKANNKKRDIFHEFYLLMSDQIDYNSFLKKYNFKYLVINKNEPLDKFLKSKNNTSYHIVYKNKKLLLYGKNDVNF